MLLNGEKINGLEDFLAEAMPATLASLRELLGSAQETGVSLGITISATGPLKDRTLEETWNFVRDDHAEQYRLVKHCKSTHEEDRAKTHEVAPANKVPTLSNEKLAERLMTELLTDGGDPESIDSDGADEAALDMAAPAKNRLAGAQNRSGAPGKNGTQEKAPAAKAKPRQTGDEDAPPPVPVKYWIGLSAAALMLIGVWAWQYSSRPMSPEQLATLALSGGKAEDRANAVVELSMIEGKEAIPSLRRLVKESEDPEVKVRAVAALAVQLDPENSPLFVAQLGSPEKSIREAALGGLLRIYGGTLPDGLDFRADDSAENRGKALRQLQAWHEKAKNTPPPP